MFFANQIQYQNFDKPFSDIATETWPDSCLLGFTETAKHRVEWGDWLNRLIFFYQNCMQTHI